MSSHLYKGISLSALTFQSKLNTHLPATCHGHKWPCSAWTRRRGSIPSTLRWLCLHCQRGVLPLPLCLWWWSQLKWEKKNKLIHLFPCIAFTMYEQAWKRQWLEWDTASFTDMQVYVWLSILCLNNLSAQCSTRKLLEENTNVFITGHTCRYQLTVVKLIRLHNLHCIVTYAAAFNLLGR